MFHREGTERLLWAELGFATLIIATLVRLIWVQGVKAEEYKKSASEQYQKSIEIPAQRGIIYDRNGKPLAFDRPVESFYAITYQVKEPERLDSVFCSIFNEQRGHYTAKLRHRFGFVWLQRGVSLSDAERIHSADIAGIYSIRSFRRVYPYGHIGAQLIGCTDIDDRGIEGVESFYNDYLAGVPGRAVFFADAVGNTNPVLSFGGKPPVAGANIHLSIDIDLQSIVETELAAGVDTNHADGGHCIFMDPHTGEILAIASYPGYNPNHKDSSTPETRKIRSITDTYEPGSIFKIVTFCAAVQESIVSTQDSIFCEHGKYITPYRTIRDVENMDWLKIPDIVVHSSNIGIIKLAAKVPHETLYEYAIRFGFGSLTGIDLLGEVGGTVHPPGHWSALSPLAFPMGYEVSVTPLQIASAYGSIANGGILMQPYVIKKIVEPQGNIVVEHKPRQVRQVINSWMDSVMIATLARVVTEGTARRVKTDGISIAGKTGTAKKAKLGGGGYWENQYYASFVGFFPVENPQMVGIVAVDNPKMGKYYGGSVAGPIFKRIAEKALSAGLVSSPLVKAQHLPDETAPYVPVPDLVRMTLSQAEQLIKERRLIPQIIGQGELVYSQKPSPGEQVPEKSIVSIYLYRRDIAPLDSIPVPNLIGLSARDALMRLSSREIFARLIGHGIVISQDPKPSTIIPSGGYCLIRCEEAIK